MDIINQLGELAIGSRLKRLSDYTMSEGEAIYKSYGLDFDPKCFPVYYALSENEKMGIMELAETLRLSHPAIIKLAKALEKKGYITSFKDEKDRRKRWLKLSEAGRAILPQMQLVWKDIAQSLSSMMGQHEHHILQAVMATEGSFTETSFLKRVKTVRNQRLLNEIEILDYQPQYLSYYQDINYAWIEKYFKIEQPDIDSLQNPERDIINKGGAVIFARYEGQIAGTVALKKYDDSTFELIKMGVNEAYLGKQIGKKLGLACIEKAKALGCKLLFLESNKSLKPALGLYQTLGFKEVKMSGSVSDYERANIRMEMNL